MVVDMSTDSDTDKAVDAVADALCRYEHPEGFAGELGRQACLRHVHMARVAVGALAVAVPIEECGLTFAHTRHWCGNEGCRDS